MVSPEPSSPVHASTALGGPAAALLLMQDQLAGAQRQCRQLQDENEELRQAHTTSQASYEVCTDVLLQSMAPPSMTVVTGAGPRPTDAQPDFAPVGFLQHQLTSMQGRLAEMEQERDQLRQHLAKVRQHAPHALL